MSRSAAAKPPTFLWLPIPVVVSALVALVVRLAHFSQSIRNPLRYQPAPDEDFYLTFAAAISNGDTVHAIYGFMDPLYGYVVWALGSNPFTIALFQVLLDCLTTALVSLLAFRWGGLRASWGAGLTYALSAAAVLYTSAVLKASWVAAILVLWLFLACRAWRSGSSRDWMLLGVMGGVATALRGNLLALSLVMACLLLWNGLRGARRPDHAPRFLRWSMWLFAGSLPILLALSIHQQATSKRHNPLPVNAGIVLHQVYNADNPRAVQFAPAFVSRPHPREIWYGYSAEAERRTGRSLEPGEVDDYWRHQAIMHLLDEPLSVATNMARKFLELFSAREKPNNLSIDDERRFSTVLRWLPDTSGILTALALVGLWVLRRRPEAPAIAIPVVVVVGTFIVFYAESRFRFHLLPVSCSLSGVALAEVWNRLRGSGWWPAFRLLVPALLLSTLASTVLDAASAPGTDWERITQGYVNMNEIGLAHRALKSWEAEQGETGDILRIRAMIHYRTGNSAAAIDDNRAAIRLNPKDSTAWFNLALALSSMDNQIDALDAAETAARVDPSPRNRLLWATALEFAGRQTEAKSLYDDILANTGEAATPIERQQAMNGLERMRNTTGGIQD